MLLNEFLNEHRTVQELKSEIATLTTTVKEQTRADPKSQRAAGSERTSIADRAK